MKTNQIKTFMFMLLLAIGTLGMASAKSITVSGRVTSAANGAAIVNCVITAKSTSQKNKTDKNGNYSMTVKEGELLIFTCAGYGTRKIAAKTARLDVVLFIQVKVPEPLVEEKDEMKECCVVAMEARKICGNSVAYKQRSYCAPASPPENEEYNSFDDNRFKEVSDAPLSTFSVDVDAASYSNMRRYINRGELPPKDAIRTEELINYFSYNYPKPVGSDPVRIVTEAGVCPWNKEHRLVRIGIKAKEIPAENLPVSNLVFLIDVSGSMYGPTRLDLVKSSLKLLVNNLRDKDKVAIVVYAGAAGIKLESTPGSDKQKIREAIDELTSGGSTAGGAGIQLAYKVAKANYINGGNNRIILCTDGDFNVGVSSVKGLEQLVEQERKSGVALTVLGYGMGNYKDNRVQTLAEKGNGNHAYIDNIQEANKVLVHEFGSTLYMVAKDVKLQVEFNPAQVQAYRLIGYESRLLKDEDFNNDAKDAGDLGVGHTVTALYEIVPVGVEGSYTGKIDALKYQKNTKKTPVLNTYGEMLTVKLRYKEPDKMESKKIEVNLVDNRSERVSSDFYFASAVAMFGQLLRDSDFKGDATFDKVIQLANKGLDNDEKGYRREFIRLVEAAKGLSQ